MTTQQLIFELMKLSFDCPEVAQIDVAVVLTVAQPTALDILDLKVYKILAVYERVGFGKTLHRDSCWLSFGSNNSVSNLRHTLTDSERNKK